MDSYTFSSSINFLSKTLFWGLKFYLGFLLLIFPLNQGGEQSKKTEGYDERTEARFGPSDPEMEEVLETLMIRILGLEPELLASELSVRVLQVYLRLMSSHQAKTARGVARHLLTVCYSNPEVVDWEDVSTVRLLECVVEVGVNNKKLGPIILTTVLGGKMAELAAHPVANFVVQRVVGQIEDKEQFMTILAEVGAEGRVEEILATGCTGVLLALAKATVRYFISVFLLEVKLYFSW